MVVAVILAAAAFGVYSLWSRRESGPMPFQSMSMEKLTNTGKVTLATVSADGQYVFNVHDDGSGQQSLWMRHIATGSNKEILPAAESRYTGLTFSPDGSYLYFRAHRAAASQHWSAVQNSGAGRDPAEVDRRRR